MIKTGVSCYGCGVCVAECKRSAITMGLSPDGFLAPDVDMEQCSNCGQCDKVCSFVDDMITEQCDKITEAAYSGVTKDSETLLNVTSGGVAFELGKICLQNGYSVIGCAYDYTRQMAVHIIANDEKELKLTMGSKYIQSWTNDVLKRIDMNKKYAVFGSPCQIDSLRRFTRKNNCEQNWIFIDFFCHGVPSYHLWKKYIDYRTKKNNTEVAMVKFRDKKNGWGIYTMTMSITMTNGNVYSRTLNKNDFFLNMFLGNYVLNEPCYSCKFHGLKSAGDIRVGDFWGKKYEDNKTGVSLAIVFTETGANLLKDVETSCLITKETINAGLEGQISKNLTVPKNREKIINELKTQKSLAMIYFIYCVKHWRGYVIHEFLKKMIRFVLKSVWKG